MLVRRKNSRPSVMISFARCPTVHGLAWQSRNVLGLSQTSSLVNPLRVKTLYGTLSRHHVTTRAEVTRQYMRQLLTERSRSKSLLPSNSTDASCYS